MTFLQTPSGAGIWHEAFEANAGHGEAIYHNCR